MNPAVVSTWVVLPLLGLSVLFAAVRLGLGPTLADRVLALDILSFIGVALLAALAVANDEPNLLDPALAMALAGFLTTVAFARLLERRGASP